jgi:hypothetical protein
MCGTAEQKASHPVAVHCAVDDGCIAIVNRHGTTSKVALVLHKVAAADVYDRPHVLVHENAATKVSLRQHLTTTIASAHMGACSLRMMPHVLFMKRRHQHQPATAFGNLKSSLYCDWLQLLRCMKTPPPRSACGSIQRHT